MSEAPRAPESPARTRSARWLDRLSAILLVAALAGVVAVAAPALSSQAPPAPSIEEPSPPHPTAPPPFRWDAPPQSSGVSASDTPPRFDLDGEPRQTELERMYPDGMWPGHGAHDRVEVPGGGVATKPRPGTASVQLTLRESPDAKAKVEGVVPAGEKLLVIRIKDGWALVAHRFEGVGWAPQGQVAIP